MTRIAGLFTLVLLGACSATPAADPPGATAIPDDTPFQLGIGQHARLADGSQLTYLRLVNDSRCPPDVQCVWAGNAEIALRWQPASGASQAIALHTSSRPGPTQARIGGRTVALVALERGIAPKATLRTQAD